LGDIDAIKSPLYDAPAFLAECRFAGVDKVVHVESDARAQSPSVEPNWVRSMVARASLPTALVVHLDLGDALTAASWEALAGPADVRGVRDFGVVGYLQDPERAPGFEANMVAMQRAGLLLDLDCSWEHMALARRFAEDHERLVVVLEHVGYPRRRDDVYFANWSAAIHDLARSENVYCKLSGLGMTDRNWTTGSLRRWVLTCLEAFGTSRCLFGSNWPVDRIASSYDALVAGFRELISVCTEAEQEAICSANAERLYFGPRR
jgi:predicted TIM-barrel fold metal-dependent hydrolase